MQWLVIGLGATRLILALAIIISLTWKPVNSPSIPTQALVLPDA